MRPRPLAVHRDDAEHVLAHVARGADARHLALLDHRALDGRRGHEAVVVPHQQKALGGRPEHRPADPLRHGHRREARVERQELVVHHLLARRVVQAVRVFLHDVERGLERGRVHLAEQQIVRRGLDGGLGDELLADRGRGLAVGRDALELHAMAHGQLEDAIGGRHPRGLVHVELFDDLRAQEQPLLVGRHELGDLLARVRRDLGHGRRRQRGVREDLLDDPRVLRVARRHGREDARREVPCEGASEERRRQLVQRRARRRGDGGVGRLREQDDDRQRLARPDAGGETLGRHLAQRPGRRRIEDPLRRGGERLDVERRIHCGRGYSFRPRSRSR